MEILRDISNVSDTIVKLAKVENAEDVDTYILEDAWDWFGVILLLCGILALVWHCRSSNGKLSRTQRDIEWYQGRTCPLEMTEIDFTQELQML